MSDPAITVLMTVLNAGRFLEPSIRSILSQTFRDFEFLIVDDASTDGSTQLAEAWAARDSRITVIRNAINKGQTACLNQGLGLAHGRWIARHDADDLAHPTRLAVQHRFATIQPEIVLLGTNGRIIDEQDRLVGLLDAPLSHQGITWTAPFLNPFMHTSVMFRTDVIRDEFGGYDTGYRIAQDYELWTRVIARYPSANLPERLICYRHLATSMSKIGRDQAFAEATLVSNREARHIFGRELSKTEARLIASFREGLDPSTKRAFWKLYNGLLSSRDSRAGDMPRTVAMHHLKAAGALSSASLRLALAEIFVALRTDPAATLRWLATRYLNA
ncbi:MAG TPA: glycosyltransferase [Terrimicrobiaceae bacterium]